MILVDLHQSGDGRRTHINYQQSMARRRRPGRGPGAARGCRGWRSRGAITRGGERKIDREEKPVSMALPGPTALQVTLKRSASEPKTWGILLARLLLRSNTTRPLRPPRLWSFRHARCQTEGNHHGADDNGSGPPRSCGSRTRCAQAQPARTIVFAAFSGEELGLVGFVTTSTAALPGVNHRDAQPRHGRAAAGVV
jgi:hypothetical protein